MMPKLPPDPKISAGSDFVYFSASNSAFELPILPQFENFQNQISAFTVTFTPFFDSHYPIILRIVRAYLGWLIYFCIPVPFTLTSHHLRPNSKAQKQCLKRPSSSNGQDTSFFCFRQSYFTVTSKLTRPFVIIILFIRPIIFFIVGKKVVNLTRYCWGLVNFTTILLSYSNWSPLPKTAEFTFLFLCIPVSFTLITSTVLSPFQ